MPTLTVPNLFIPDKLVTVQNGPNPGFKHGRSRSASFAGDISQVPRSLTPLPPSSLQNVCTSNAQDPRPKNKSELPTLEGVSAPTSTSDKEVALPFAAEPTASLSRPPAPPSYKSALQAAHVVTTKVVRSRPVTPELDAAGSSGASDTSDEASESHTSLLVTGSRHVNPNIVEHFLSAKSQYCR